jgi:uncharacterized membrane protein YuzA (DUF378 family)
LYLGIRHTLSTHVYNLQGLSSLLCCLFSICQEEHVL